MEADKVIFKQYELDNEIWKDIPNYENLYQVSDLGRVRRLPNRIITKRGSKVIGAKILNQNFDKNKYVGELPKQDTDGIAGYTASGLLEEINQSQNFTETYIQTISAYINLLSRGTFAPEEMVAVKSK